MKRRVILNPQSRNGKAGRLFESQRDDWRRLLGDFEVSLTKGPGDAADLAHDAIRGGEVDQLLVAGGDGVISETVRGYWEGGEPIEGAIPLGIINLGTGGDLFRTVESASENYREALVENRFHRIDAPFVVAGTEGSDSGLLPFINMASLGMGGEMLARMSRSRFRSGAPAYYYHTLRTLVGFRPRAVEMELVAPDAGRETVSQEILNAFVCNGRFSGGGMEWAPGANLESGHFCVTLVGGVGKANLVRHSRQVYAGRLDRFPGARTFVASEVVIRVDGETALETDGEIFEGSEAIREFRFGLRPAGIPIVM